MADMSIAAFMGHLAGFTLRVSELEHQAMDEAARVVQREAKAEIGTYQSEVGPFAAWAQLAESTLAEKTRLGYAPPDNPLLRTGELRDSIERAVGVREAVVGSNSEVAVYQEIGTEKMPPRSFLGGAAMRKAEEVARLVLSAEVTALIGRDVPGLPAIRK